MVFVLTLQYLVEIDQALLKIKSPYLLSVKALNRFLRTTFKMYKLLGKLFFFSLETSFTSAFYRKCFHQ